MGVIVDGLSWALLLSGSFFVVVSAVGVLRMPDFFTRLHAAGIIDTLGVMLIVAGLMLQAGFTLASVKLFLIFVFVLFTTPTATHALAKAALHGGLRPSLVQREDGQSQL